MPRKTTNECVKCGADVPCIYCEAFNEGAFMAPHICPNTCSKHMFDDLKPGKVKVVTQCKDGNPDCVCGEEEAEGWRERFDREFDHYNPKHDDGVQVATFCGSDFEGIKAFIAEELKKQAKEVREDQKRIDANTIENVYKLTGEQMCEQCIDRATDAILNTNKES